MFEDVLQEDGLEGCPSENRGTQGARDDFEATGPRDRDRSCIRLEPDDPGIAGLADHLQELAGGASDLEDALGRSQVAPQ
ncbi:MAG: hypothetical protein NZL87_05120 [Thermomicrobium sp.]|nr:hypothetical protein [Thermomicrobium sp.]